MFIAVMIAIKNRSGKSRIDFILKAYRVFFMKIDPRFFPPKSDRDKKPESDQKGIRLNRIFIITIPAGYNGLQTYN
jgi:hypothetical protein